MGAASLKLGRFDEALGYLRDRPLPEDGQDPYRFHSLLLAGVALEALGRDPDAAESYKKILSDKAAASFFPGGDIQACRSALQVGTIRPCP